MKGDQADLICSISGRFCVGERDIALDEIGLPSS